MNPHTRIALIAASMAMAAGVVGCSRAPVDPVSTAGTPAVAMADPDLDVRIHDAIRAAYLNEPRWQGLNAADIRVQTTDGVAVLSGTVKSQADSDHAQQLANSIEGVKAVDNRLTVKGGRIVRAHPAVPPVVRTQG